MQTAPVLVIFEGGLVASPPEHMLRQVREAIVLEHIEKAHATGMFAGVIVCTERPELAERARALGADVDLDPPGVPFHFGERLQGLIRDRGLTAVVSMGGGAVPLISVDELRLIGRLFRDRTRFVAANNVHSADIVAFAPADAMFQIPPPPMDNSLALALHYDAGLPLVALPRTLGFHFDVDTPSDMLVLAVHPDRGPRVAQLADELVAHADIDLTPLESAKRTLVDPTKDVFIFGRLGGPLFSYLDERARSRIRLLSEERGMKALGRDVRGEVRSLLGYMVDAVGTTGLVRMLETLCSTAFLDTRVLMAHAQKAVSAADRFYSDLMLPEHIQDPWLRELTAAAAESELPILLGGHGLVHGGIWALVDAAHREGLAALAPRGVTIETADFQDDVRDDVPDSAPGTPRPPGTPGSGSPPPPGTPG